MKHSKNNDYFCNSKPSSFQREFSKEKTSTSIILPNFRRYKRYDNLRQLQIENHFPENAIFGFSESTQVRKNYLNYYKDYCSRESYISKLQSQNDDNNEYS